MRRLIFLMLLVAGSALANDTDVQNVSTQALKFNKWYISQIIKDVYPIADDINSLKPYVDADTIKKLETSYRTDEFESGSDYFLKVQNFEDDNWKDNVSIERVVPEPVCTSVYVTLGTGKDSRKVIDCMVKENGVWRIKYVTAPDYN